MPISELFQLSHSPEIWGDAQHVTLSACRAKFPTSRRRHMMYCSFHLQDILDLWSYSPEQLPMLMDHLIALSGLVFYELDCYFLCDPQSEKEFRCSKIAKMLLSVVVQIGNLIRSRFGDLQHFYFFNLATMDVEFLKAHLSQEMIDSLDKRKERNCAVMIQDLADGLSALDRSRYDQHYKFTPWLVAQGGVQKQYCDIKRREKISFLDPVFEHLAVIRLHISFAENPMSAFCQCCRIPSLRSYADLLFEHVRDEDVSLRDCASILNLFSFFQWKRVLPQLLKDVAKLSTLFPLTQHTVYDRLVLDVFFILRVSFVPPCLLYLLCPLCPSISPLEN
jgi:hypothetical protein